MDTPFIFIGTYSIRQGKLEAFKEHIKEFCRYVEENEPRLIHFGCYFDEPETEVSFVQVHPDPASMELHMQVISEHLESAFDYLEKSRGMQVFGAPGEALMQLLKPWATPEAPLLLKRPVDGFSRLPAPAAV